MFVPVIQLFLSNFLQLILFLFFFSIYSFTDTETHLRFLEKRDLTSQNLKKNICLPACVCRLQIKLLKGKLFFNAFFKMNIFILQGCQQKKAKKWVFCICRPFKFFSSYISLINWTVICKTKKWVLTFQWIAGSPDSYRFYGPFPPLRVQCSDDNKQKWVVIILSVKSELPL